jgi:hypothetical protein
MIDKSPAAVIDWQRRLAAQPKVWVVLAGDVGYADEQTGNLYASREAAQLEVDWLLANGTKRARASSIGCLHSFELSKERWQP